MAFPRLRFPDGALASTDYNTNIDVDVDVDTMVGAGAMVIAPGAMPPVP